MAINKAKLAAELVGLGPGGGGLEKLTITYDTLKAGRYDAFDTGRVEALFNPSEIHTSRSVTYEQKRVAASTGDASYFDIEQQLRSVEAATLTVDLFFDTYESRSDASSWKRAAASALTALNPFPTSDATDVTDLTDKVARLALPAPELHQPPVCHLKWGRFDIFDGVLSSIDQRFTMFLSDGTPVRATLSCTFVEFRTEAHVKASEMHSADVAKTHVVRRNDTLQSIAADQYDDPALWRPIARANGIVNPRGLSPGTVLLIPKLRP
jgi:nucleoid-associated protein YgaU